MEHPQTYILPFVLVLVFGGYAVWMMTRAKKAQAGLGPAMHAFFARSGYRYADMPPEPIEAHVHRAMTDMQRWSSGGFETVYVRSFHGLPIEFASGMQATHRGTSLWCRWTARLARPPRIPFQIADKSLASFGKVLREAFSNTTRQWSAIYPHPVQTGIPPIDDRFVVYGADPNAVRFLFHQNPAFVALLLQCTEVDLRVEQQRAVFADPEQKNMNAAMGGMVGQMALGLDYAKRMDMSLPVHDRMAELLAMAVRAAQ